MCTFKQFKTGIIFSLLLMSSTFGYADETQVCSNHTCHSISFFDQQSVMTKLAGMFNKKQIVLCAANPETKKCLIDPLSFKAQTTLMNVDFQVPFMRILQKKRIADGLTFVLDYQIKTNEKYPKCSPSVSDFTLYSNEEIWLSSPAFKCYATELGNTFLTFQFQIDYINFDTGWFGANYEVASSGDVVGEGNGYVMMQASPERYIPLKRPLPEQTSGIKNLPPDNDNLNTNYYDDNSYDPNESGKLVNWNTSKLVDWDMENIQTEWANFKVKWDNFSEKFMKFLYLEPME